VLGSRPSQLRPTQTSAVVSLGARRDEPTRFTPELVAGAPWVGQGARTRHGVRANIGRCGGSLARTGHRLSATNSSELAVSLTDSPFSRMSPTTDVPFEFSKTVSQSVIL